MHMEQDRIKALQQRIIQLKQQCKDMYFAEYLDRTWNDVRRAEDSIQQIEQQLEYNYSIYQQNHIPQQQQTYIEPQAQVQQAYVQPQAQVQQTYVQPQQMYVQPQVQTQYVQSAKPGQSMEFKVGTILLGVIGIAFLLVAFVTFGLNYMNDLLQGIFLYAMGIVVLLSSELFFAKRVEKFSYCLTGLGISSLYITTLLNYIYLKVFPGWVALLITIVVTGFFFWMSWKKDSGMIRIICLIGCYISLVPMQEMEHLTGFILPALLVFSVNLAGVFCPLRKRRVGIDWVQYICSFILVFYLIYMLWISGLEMWPAFIMVCGMILTIHLLYFKSDKGLFYEVLYHGVLAMSVGCLLYLCNHEYWIHYGVIGMTVLMLFMTVLLWKTKLRFVPYLYLSVYAVWTYMMDEKAFWMTLVCLLIFVVNKACVRFFKEFPMPDAIYTMVSAIGVCLFARNGEAQILGYIYACCILLSCIFVKEYKTYHIYTCLSFGWIFLLTEGFKPFLCSILICTLAAVAIGAGFYRRDKGIRIYGLVLLTFVALKLVIYDFLESQAAIRILVFLVVGLLILGVSFLYIYLEKKLNEEENRKIYRQQGMNLPPM